MMRIHHARPGPARSPRVPRRTARLRLTVLYGAAFLVCGACGAAVLAVTALLYGHLAPPQVHQTKQSSVITKHPVVTLPPATPPQSPPGVHVTVAGLGQLTIDRQGLLIIAAVALAVFVAGAVALGWPPSPAPP